MPPRLGGTQPVRIFTLPREGGGCCAVIECYRGGEVTCGTVVGEKGNDIGRSTLTFGVTSFRDALTLAVWGVSKARGGNGGRGNRGGSGMLCCIRVGRYVASVLFSLLFSSSIFSFHSSLTSVQALNNGLALTPPMGWISWVRYQCNLACTTDPDNCISEKLYMTMADALISGGYRDAGYVYVCIDDCWLAPTRDSNNRLQADPIRFPSGIPFLANYMHARGLKLGIYEDVGNLTCAGYPGSKGHYEIDAQTFAAWGVDMVKLDGCNANLNDYAAGFIAMGSYLNATGRPIVYSCQWPMYARYYGGMVDYPMIASTCNLFRALTDVYYAFQSVQSEIQYYATNPYNFSYIAGPGAWNDPDQLVLGNYGLSDDEERVQIAMWAMMAAPLLMSNDLRQIRPSSKALLLNSHVIAVSQDPLGKQGTQVIQQNLFTVWMRQQMPAGSWAIAFLNSAADTGPSLIVFKLMSLPNILTYMKYTVLEVFNNETLGVFRPTYNISIYVNPNGVYLMKVIPVMD